ncbi:CHASE domain-containing protein [Paracoccus sp. p3-h83]|uniref:CHASE domain-containing protein n=1 Tax=Paracoccus sp. p3-h83 TaxID=3342805 RepID=UPI0035B885B4
MLALLRHRLMPLVLLLGLLLAGAALTLAVARLEEQTIQGRLERRADLTAYQIGDRIREHLALLRATASQFESPSGEMDAREFADYVRSLGLSAYYTGIQGIGFARLMPAANSPNASAEIAQNYGQALPVRPRVASGPIAPIVLLEPQDDRNIAALGYDMFSEKLRRAAIVRAMETDAPAASAPVELVQEITEVKQAGFLIYVPAHSLRRPVAADPVPSRPERSISGLIYAPFRAGDLHRAALVGLAKDGLRLRSIDIGSDGGLLFDSAPEGSPPPSPDTRQAVRDITVAGRDWRITVTPEAGFYNRSDFALTLLVGALSLLLALALGAAARASQARLRSIAHSARLAARLVHDRDLLLGEMTHRIKNHIARIQAIARHTRRSAPDLETFDQLFSGRLRSMAAAQDLLVAGRAGSADLRDLIRTEMEQIMATPEVDAALSGPPVPLSPDRTRAMALVIHELTTNALKYGGNDGRAPAISVDWSVTKGQLRLTWREAEALIEGDLEGHFSRRFGPDGLRVEITVPLTDAARST